MDEYVNKELLLKNINLLAKYQHGDRQQGILGVCETVKRIPAADIVEVRHGRMDDGECTVCGWFGDCVDTPYYNYCPNCGAKMDK